MNIIYNHFTGQFDYFKSNFNIGQSGIKNISGGDYTALLSDTFLKVDGTLTVNLYSTVGIDGRIIVIKNVGNGAVTLDPFGDESIDGDAIKVITEPWISISLLSDDNNWFIL